MTITFSSVIGGDTSTSYNSIEELQQHWFNSGYDYSSLSDNDIIRYLNRSTSYIDNTYRTMFPGYRDSETQSLEWPRFGATYIDGHSISEDVVPTEVKRAVSELAYLLHQGEDPEAIIQKQGKIISESVKVDVISESKRYEDGSSFYNDIYQSVDNLLSRIIGSGSAFALKIIRVGGESG